MTISDGAPEPQPEPTPAPVPPATEGPSLTKSPAAPASGPADPPPTPPADPWQPSEPAEAAVPPPPAYQAGGYPPPSYAPPPPYAPPGYLPPGYGGGYGPPQPGAPWGTDQYGRPYSEKSKVIAGVLQIVLGGVGAGRWYTGHYGIAIAQLLTCGGLGVWALVDGILMLVGNVTDVEGRPLRG